MTGRRRRRSRETKRAGRNVSDLLYPTLDLHGMTADEATRAAERWLWERRAAGEPTVRLITGRGLHSVGPPVLPRAIESLLANLRGSLVQSSDREPGGGAFRVQLTRRALEPQSAVQPSAIEPDPELMRLAEEALAELGVYPTPALVEAEIRRILRERGNT
jgi:hypothetical protein